MHLLRITLPLLLGWSAMAAGQKRSVAVEAFDYSAVRVDIHSIFGIEVNVGEGIRALMARRIAQDGQFTVVERKKIDTVMHEQDFAASGRVKRGTGPRTGQIRGAELQLVGDIVAFGRDDRRKSAGGLVATGGGGVAAAGSKKTNRAVVVVSYRLVDAESSEVVAAGEARGESQRESKGFGAAMLLGGVFGGGFVDMTASNFAQTIIGEAVIDVCDKLAADLRGRSAAVGARQIEVDARIADVSGSNLVLNAGSGAGLRSGDRLVVYSLGKPIKDPVTGEVLDQAADRIGEMVITQVRERTSTGAYSGSGAPKVGDAARNE